MMFFLLYRSKRKSQALKNCYKSQPLGLNAKNALVPKLLIAKPEVDMKSMIPKVEAERKPIEPIKIRKPVETAEPATISSIIQPTLPGLKLKICLKNTPSSIPTKQPSPPKQQSTTILGKLVVRKNKAPASRSILFPPVTTNCREDIDQKVESDRRKIKKKNKKEKKREKKEREAAAAAAVAAAAADKEEREKQEAREKLQAATERLKLDETRKVPKLVIKRDAIIPVHPKPADPVLTPEKQLKKIEEISQLSPIKIQRGVLVQKPIRKNNKQNPIDPISIPTLMQKQKQTRRQKRSSLTQPECPASFVPQQKRLTKVASDHATDEPERQKVMVFRSRSSRHGSRSTSTGSSTSSSQESSKCQLDQGCLVTLENIEFKELDDQATAPNEDGVVLQMVQTDLKLLTSSTKEPRTPKTVAKKTIPKIRIRLGPSQTENGKHLSVILSDLAKDSNDQTAEPENLVLLKSTQSYDDILKERIEPENEGLEQQDTYVIQGTNIGHALDVLLSFQIKEDIVGSILNDIIASAVTQSMEKTFKSYLSDDDEVDEHQVLELRISDEEDEEASPIERDKKTEEKKVAHDATSSNIDAKLNASSNSNIPTEVEVQHVAEHMSTDIAQSSEFKVIRVPSVGRLKTKIKRAGSGLRKSDYTKRRVRRKLDKLIIKNVSRIAATTTITSPVVEENESKLVCMSILQQLLDTCCQSTQAEEAAVVLPIPAVEAVEEQRRVPPLKIKSSQINTKQHKKSCAVDKKEKVSKIADDDKSQDETVRSPVKTNEETLISPSKKIIPPQISSKQDKIVEAAQATETKKIEPLQISLRKLKNVVIAKEDKRADNSPKKLVPLQISIRKHKNAVQTPEEETVNLPLKKVVPLQMKYKKDEGKTLVVVAAKGEDVNAVTKKVVPPIKLVLGQSNKLTKGKHDFKILTVNLSKVDLDSDMMGKPSKRHPGSHNAESTNTKKSKPGPKSRSRSCEKPATSVKRKLCKGDEDITDRSKLPKVTLSKNSANEEDLAVLLPTEKPDDEKEMKVDFHGKRSKSTEINIEDKSNCGAIKTDTAVKHHPNLSAQSEKTESQPVRQERKTVEKHFRQTPLIDTRHLGINVAQPQASVPKTLLVQNPPFFARKSAPKIVHSEEEVPTSSKVPLEVVNQKPEVVNAHIDVGAKQEVTKSAPLRDRSASQDKHASISAQLLMKTGNSSKTDSVKTTKVNENILIKTAIEKIRHTPDNFKVSSMIDELFNNVMDCYKTDDSDDKTKKADKIGYNIKEKDENAKKSKENTCQAKKADETIAKMDCEIDKRDLKSESELTSRDIVNQLVNIAVNNAEAERRNADCDTKSNSDIDTIRDNSLSLEPEELCLANKGSTKTSENIVSYKSVTETFVDQPSKIADTKNVASDLKSDVDVEAIENTPDNIIEQKQVVEHDQEEVQVHENESVVMTEQSVLNKSTKRDTKLFAMKAKSRI